MVGLLATPGRLAALFSAAWRRGVGRASSLLSENTGGRNFTLGIFTQYF